MSLVIGWHAPPTEIEEVVRLHLEHQTGWCPAVQVFLKSPSRTGSITAKIKPTIKELLDRVYLVVHGSYLINFMKSKLEWALKSVVDDIRFLDALIPEESKSRTGVVIHLGKNTEQLSFEECVDAFSRNVVEVLERTRDQKVRLILETSVRSENDLFWSIENFGKLSHRIEELVGKELYESRIGFCVDTAHIFASGYDIRSVEGVRAFLSLWDEHIGVRRITLIHLNDSKVGLGCCRDLHQQIGKGEIYAETTEGLRFLLEWCSRSYTPMVIESGGDMDEEMRLLLQTHKL